MNKEQWQSLKHGDKIKNKYTGDIEVIYEFMNELYIEGIKSLFPIAEFNSGDWEIVRVLERIREDT